MFNIRTIFALDAFFLVNVYKIYEMKRKTLFEMHFVGDYLFIKKTRKEEGIIREVLN